MALWKMLVGVVSLVALAALLVCAVAGKDGQLGWRDQRAFVGTSVSLPGPASAAVLVQGSREIPLVLDASGESARLPVGARRAAVVRVTPKDASVGSAEIHLSLIDREYGYGAAIAGLALFFVILYACSPNAGASSSSLARDLRAAREG